MRIADRHLHADAEGDAWDDAHQYGNDDDMNHLHAQIDAHAERAKQELHDMTREALDRLSVKVGWMIRSMGAKQGWRNRKAKGAGK